MQARAQPTDGDGDMAHALRGVVVAYAPNKQVGQRAGEPNREIGRTPGSACEAMRFLSRLVAANREDAIARNKLVALADWVIELQAAGAGKPWQGAVPSTPDLPAPANQYYYAIDAAFCSDALFRAFDVTGEARYRAAALEAADFLVAMHRGPGRREARGVCEAMVANGDGAALWNCKQYVKNLVALPALRRAARISGRNDYEAVAATVRKFLVTGLEGAWEYAETVGSAGCRAGQSCSVTWKRIEGPHKQPNYFVYGDTLAYGLRGLFEYEGASPVVRRLYDAFAGYKGKDNATRDYDGRIAFAGYMRPATRTPDPFSAYYDIVTMGILHELRLVHRPAHAVAASAVLGELLRDGARVSWKMDFKRKLSLGDHVDLTTIANLGEAVVVEGQRSTNR
jgi:hypothetical protein